MAKTAVVIYHDADYDGLGSAAVCQLHLRHAGISTELIGWDYNRPDPVVPDETDLIFIVDLNVPSLMNDPRLVWIDHHKTAIDSYPKSIRGLRIDGVAACRLCWQWFTNPPDGEDGYWSLSDFQNREIEEPLLLTLLGEYDVWDLHDERTEWMQYFLKAEGADIETIRVLLQIDDEKIDEMAGTGASIKRYADAYFRDTLKGSFIAKFDDKVRFLCCCAVRMNSAGFNQTDVDSSEFDAYLRFHVTPTDVNISVYHAPHNESIDLGKLAKQYGGGGHKGAAGFRLSMDEFRRLLLGQNLSVKESKARTKSGTTPGNRKYSASRDDFGQRTTVVSQPGKAYVKRTFYTGRKDKFVIEPGKKAPKSTWGPGPTKKLNKTRSNKN